MKTRSLVVVALLLLPVVAVPVDARAFDLMRSEGAVNLQWVWHANWYDEPETKWNAFENYFPGETYCDWVALSAYGPLTPRTVDGLEGFRFQVDQAYPRLIGIAPGKPVIIAEFGCDLHNHHVNAARWAKSALDDLFSNRWPAIADRAGRCARHGALSARAGLLRGQ